MEVIYLPTEFIIRIVLSAIVLLVLVIILIRSSKGKTKATARDSLDVMKERLEKGEITQEDYDDAKKRRGKS